MYFIYLYVCMWNKNCPILIVFVNSGFGISSLLLMFHTQNRREPESRWTCCASRLHQAGGNAAMGHQPFASPPSKSSQYRAETLPGKGAGNASMTLMFWHFIITINIHEFRNKQNVPFLRFSDCLLVLEASISQTVYFFFPEQAV